jgi:hypothetical protein
MTTFTCISLTILVSPILGWASQTFFGFLFDLNLFITGLFLMLNGSVIAGGVILLTLVLSLTMSALDKLGDDDIADDNNRLELPRRVVTFHPEPVVIPQPEIIPPRRSPRLENKTPPGFYAKLLAKK